jgi:hypothetical protein
MVAVRGELGRGEPPVERGHCPVACLSERREQVTVAVRRVGKSVHAQRERAVSLCHVLERQLIRPDCSSLEVLHSVTSFAMACQM